MGEVRGKDAVRTACEWKRETGGAEKKKERSFNENTSAQVLETTHATKAGEQEKRGGRGKSKAKPSSIASFTH